MASTSTEPGRPPIAFLQRYSIEIAWWLFVVANAVATVTFAEWGTVPFHVIWISLALVYGWRVWSIRSTALVLAVVVVITAATLFADVAEGDQAPDELAEIPLMAVVFLVMVWFVRRAVAFQRATADLSERSLNLLRREQRFVQDASHTLRTPLTVALGYTEVLQRTTTDDRVILDLQVVVDELLRLRRITSRLLSLASMEQVDQLHPVEASAVEVVQQVHERWVVACPALRLERLEDATVPLDPERVVEALDELIGNALAHTPGGTGIELSTWSEDGWQVLAVTDDGPGVDASQAATIFDRWSSSPNGGGAGGAGLGLAIVKAIAEAHGGNVRVSSGPGGRFELRLPRAPSGQPSPGVGMVTGRLTAK